MYFKWKRVLCASSTFKIAGSNISRFFCLTKKENLIEKFTESFSDGLINYTNLKGRGVRNMFEVDIST